LPESSVPLRGEGRCDLLVQGVSSLAEMGFSEANVVVGRYVRRGILLPLVAGGEYWEGSPQSGSRLPIHQ